MKFTLQRLYDNGHYTLGFVKNEEKTFRSFSCEDTFRAVKLAGETRIPSGFYELKINKADTPLTIKHRASYGEWFKYHIEVTGIANFKSVYVHSGNDEDYTEGCLLFGYGFDLTLLDKMQSKSLLAVKDFYAVAYPLLESGGKVFIEIKDN